jgi:hypothetical protein
MKYSSIFFGLCRAHARKRKKLREPVMSETSYRQVRVRLFASASVLPTLPDYHFMCAMKKQSDQVAAGETQQQQQPQQQQPRGVPSSGEGAASALARLRDLEQLQSDSAGSPRPAGN